MPIPRFPAAGELYQVVLTVPHWCCLQIDAIGVPYTAFDEGTPRFGLKTNTHVLVIDSMPKARVIHNYIDDKDRPGTVRQFDLILTLAQHPKTDLPVKAMLVFPDNDWNKFLSKVETDND